MSVHLTAVEEAERAGFDLSLVDVSLGHTYEKRAVQHQAALDLALELERAGREFRDRTQSTAGLKPTQLLTRLIEIALARHRRHVALRSSY
jgi:hypothetical protein